MKRRREKNLTPTRRGKYLKGYNRWEEER